MRRHRTIIRIVGLLVALSVAMPAGASATSLLSGYGGPGQGNQAILGSALLNGPGGGSGSSSAPTSVGAQGVPGGLTSKRSGARRQARASGELRKAPATIASAYPASERGAQQSTSLELSGAEVLYLALALGILAFAGVLTRRLSADDRRARSQVAKEMRRGDRVTG